MPSLASAPAPRATHTKPACRSRRTTVLPIRPFPPTPRQAKWGIAIARAHSPDRSTHPTPPKPCPFTRRLLSSARPVIRLAVDVGPRIGPGTPGSHGLIPGAALCHVKTRITEAPGGLIAVGPRPPTWCGICSPHYGRKGPFNGFPPAQKKSRAKAESQYHCNRGAVKNALDPAPQLNNAGDHPMKWHFHSGLAATPHEELPNQPRCPRAAADCHRRADVIAWAMLHARLLDLCSTTRGAARNPDPDGHRDRAKARSAASD
jgi:hypothetical protein